MLHNYFLAMNTMEGRPICKSITSINRKIFQFGCCLICLLFVTSSGIYAQSPGKFNFQAVARDVDGNLYSSTTLGVRISILRAGPSGTSDYSEQHQVETSPFGVFNLEIGGGSPLLGNMTDILWSQFSYYLKIEIDPDGGANYINLGASQLVSVPYALYGEDGDADPANELQTWDNLPDIPSDFVDGVDNVNDGDTDSTNELQEISFSSNNNELSISDGNAVILPINSLWNEDNGTISYTEGNVGIGTTNPSHDLHIDGDLKVRDKVVQNIGGELNVGRRVLNVVSASNTECCNRGFKINTNIPLQASAGRRHHIDIKGFRTGTFSPFELRLSFRIDEDFPSGPIYDGSALLLSNGDVTFLAEKSPSIKVNNEDGKAVLYVESSESNYFFYYGFVADYWFYGSEIDIQGGENWYEGWTVSSLTEDVSSPSSVSLEISPSTRWDGDAYNAGNIMPSQNNQYSLGSTNFRWNTIYATNGTINTSDRRDKEHINDSPYGLKEVLQLSPVSYQWKKKPWQGAKLGFIAQDVQQIIPEAVADKFWDEKEGKQEAIPADRLGIYYSDLIPVLVRAIQEQQVIIELQDEQLAEQSRKIDDLDAVLERLNAIEKKLNGNFD